MTESATVKKAANVTTGSKTVAKRRSSTIKSSSPAKKQKSPKKITAKVKVVRDSFTMPQADYDIIADLKQKALKSGIHVKKSELLRAGLREIAKLSLAQLQKTVSGLEKIKTGRPKKD
jgi:hypothetical protein